MFGWSKGRKTARVTPVTLQEQIDALEGQFRSLKLEWTDVYDKLYRLAGRMDAAKRWAGEKTPTHPVGDKEIVPENGPEGPVLDREQAPAPARAQSRKDLLVLWKT